MNQASQPELTGEAIQLKSGVIGSASRPRRHFTFPVNTLRELGWVRLQVDQKNRIFEKKDRGRHPGPNEERVSHPIMEGHDCHRDRTIEATKTNHRRVIDGKEEKALEQRQTRATHLHVSDAFRYNSQPLQAVYTPVPTLSGKGWPGLKMERDDQERALAVWLNTTMGLIIHWAVASHTQKAMGSLTKKQLESMPVLNVRALTQDQLDEMGRIFTQFKDRPFLPANESWRDPERAELDRKVITQALRLGPEALRTVEHIRDRWCLEPTVQGNKGAAGNKKEAMDHLRRRAMEPDDRTECAFPDPPAQIPSSTTPSRCRASGSARPRSPLKLRFMAGSIKSIKSSNRPRGETGEEGPSRRRPRTLITIYQAGQVPGAKRVEISPGRAQE